MNRALRVLVVVCVLCNLGGLAGCAAEAPVPRVPAPAPDPGSSPGLQAFAPPFYPAAGGGEARFLRRDPRGVAELGRDGMRLALRGAGGTIRWGLVGARAVEPRAEGLLEGKLHFFSGHPSRWRTDVPAYSKLVYEGVYPGIDLVLESRPEGVEYSLVVAPGADLAPVRFRYQGAEVKARADGAGLELRSGRAALREEGLFCYQQDGGERRQVGARYTGVRRRAGGFEYGVQLDRHDASRPVVIDPVIIWGSYVGGSNWDTANAIALDANRDIYLAGETTSSNFPVASPIDGTLGGLMDAFVMKVDSQGSTLRWATYLGGSGVDAAGGLALDPAGNVYVTGYTLSADFPVPGGFDTSIGGTQDSFVTKLSPSGSALLWSSYLGGSAAENHDSIATDAAGNVYVAGITTSTDYPSAGGFDSTYGGGFDGAVTKISAAGSLVWSSYLGGSAGGHDDVNAVAVDAAGDVYAGGNTESLDFPTTPGSLQTLHGGSTLDGFITRINAAGSSLAWSTYLGGSGVDFGPDNLVLDATGVLGIQTTGSLDIPIAGGFDGTLGGTQDAYVFKINSGGSALAWSTYLGGSDNESSSDIGIDSAGRVFVTGATFSADFPTTGGFDTTRGGTTDGFVAQIAAGGSSLLWGSFLGGGDADTGRALAVDDLGTLYVAGSTVSADFPAPGGFDGTFGGNSTNDGFVVKIGSDGTGPAGGAVNDGPGADVDTHSSSSTLSANWSGFSDPESGISSYQWAIGTTPGGTQVLPFTGVGLATSATQSGLTMADGVTHYVTVRAFNGVGTLRAVTSDGVLVDGSPPVAGQVNDGAVGDVDFQRQTNFLRANWSSFADPHTGITLYEWAIGTTPGGTEVQAFVGVGLSTNAMNSTVSLTHGATYYVTVRARNGIGVTTTVTSDGMLVDTTSPLPGTVNDGAGADVDVQGSTTTLSANWSGFNDPESGIILYEWAIGTAPGGSNVLPFTTVGTNTSASQGGLTLLHGVTYFVTVQAHNGAFGNVQAFSDGVLVDGTPPVTAAVHDGPTAGVDVDSQTSTTTLSASWGAFSDPDTGIAGYEWAIGTTSGGADVQPFTSTGLSTSASNAGLTLVPGTRYFVSVRGINGAGVGATSTSDGVLVDPSPPVAGTVNDGVGADVDVQTSSSVIRANWSGFSDPDTGVALYEWAIGSTPGGTEVQGFVSNGTSTSAVQVGLTLSSGVTYYVTVRATNGAGFTATASSDGSWWTTRSPPPGR